MISGFDSFASLIFLFADTFKFALAYPLLFVKACCQKFGNNRVANIPTASVAKNKFRAGTAFPFSIISSTFSVFSCLLVRAMSSRIISDENTDSRPESSTNSPSCAELIRELFNLGYFSSASKAALSRLIFFSELDFSAENKYFPKINNSRVGAI